MPETEKADQRGNADQPKYTAPNHENECESQMNEAARAVKPNPTACDTCGRHRRDCVRWYNSIDHSRGYCSIACWPTNRQPASWRAAR